MEYALTVRLGNAIWSCTTTTCTEEVGQNRGEDRAWAGAKATASLPPYHSSAKLAILTCTDGDLGIQGTGGVGD